MIHTMARDRDSKAADDLRAAIERSGLSLCEIARRAGVDPGVVSRLMRDVRTVALPTADRLAAAVGLQWRLVKPRNGQKGR
jgi:transcriptional regulator with XRE-family HTH domain